MGIALQGSAIRHLSARSQLRASAKVGLTGLELELGGARRVSTLSKVGFAVALGSHVRGVWFSSFLPRTYPLTFPVLTFGPCGLFSLGRGAAFALPARRPDVYDADPTGPVA